MDPSLTWTYPNGCFPKRGGAGRRRAAKQASFRSPDGLRVRVLYSGRPRHTAGPDFRDALPEVEGVGLVQGDVEIHVR